MLSEKQIESNRENARKSTGPRTAAGKERSRLNAWRHGLTGQASVMPAEEMAACKKFTDEFAASLNPETLLERQLAQTCATFYWRINRGAALEETMLSMGLMDEVAENYQIENPEAHTATSHAKTFSQRSDEFSRLAIYSQRLLNQAEKVLKQLRQIQADRQAREEKEMKEATSIYIAFKKQGQTFDPQAAGFVLTTAKIEAKMHRNNLSDPAYVADFFRRVA